MLPLLDPVSKTLLGRFVVKLKSSYKEERFDLINLIDDTF